MGAQGAQGAGSPRRRVSCPCGAAGSPVGPRAGRRCGRRRGRMRGGGGGGDHVLCHVLRAGRAAGVPGAAGARQGGHDRRADGGHGRGHALLRAPRSPPAPDGDHLGTMLRGPPSLGPPSPAPRSPLAPAECCLPPRCASPRIGCRPAGPPGALTAALAPGGA
jgi:hypothetical protein